MLRTKEVFRYGFGTCSFGMVLVASSDYGLAAILRGANETDLLDKLRQRFRTYDLREDKKMAKIVKQVIAFIDKPGPEFKLPLDIRGTEFQMRVWREVRKIPYGATSTYSDIAEKIYKPRAVRAVGTSCTNNPLFIVLPCHRVLHKSESATNFNKASAYQRKLILREAAQQ
jgi:AraC family transcriptional regulator of adaptative response/methylated-DNA-[protein]-cysteine methyltransferase